MKKIYSLLLLVPFLVLPAMAQQQCPGREWTESKVQYILEITKNSTPEKFQCQMNSDGRKYLCSNGVQITPFAQLEDKLGNSFVLVDDARLQGGFPDKTEQQYNSDCTLFQVLNIHQFKFAPNQNADENIVMKFFELKVYSASFKPQPQL